MKIQELPDGNLQIAIETQTDRNIIKVLVKYYSDEREILSELLEWHRCNGSYTDVRPEQTGDMTDAPIIVLNFDYDGDLNVIPSTDPEWPFKKWWDPNYQLRSFADVLLENGAFEFTKA
jgi:hypothetical protein